MKSLDFCGIALSRFRLFRDLWFYFLMFSVDCDIVTLVFGYPLFML